MASEKVYLYYTTDSESESDEGEITILSKEFHKTNTYLMFWNGNKNM